MDLRSESYSCPTKPPPSAHGKCCWAACGVNELLGEFWKGALVWTGEAVVTTSSEGQQRKTEMKTGSLFSQSKRQRYRATTEYQPKKKPKISYQPIDLTHQKILLTVDFSIDVIESFPSQPPSWKTKDIQCLVRFYYVVRLRWSKH